MSEKQESKKRSFLSDSEAESIKQAKTKVDECIKQAKSKVDEHLKRGAFIVLEGIDKAGKTTQCKMLYDWLNKNGHEAVVWSFPDRTTPIGKMLNTYLTQKDTPMNDHVAHLLFVANRWEKQEELKALLLKGTTVICDRYVFSGWAYSTAKGLGLTWCGESDNGLLMPDMTILMDLPVEEAKKRQDYGSERYERLEMQRKVAHQYKHLFEFDTEGTIPIATMRANRSLATIHELIQEIAVNTITKVQRKPHRWPHHVFKALKYEEGFVPGESLLKVERDSSHDTLMAHMDATPQEGEETADTLEKKLHIVRPAEQQKEINLAACEPPVGGHAKEVPVILCLS